MNQKLKVQTQIGGTHYEDFEIQPIDVIEYYNLTFHLGNAFKYITRSRYKGNKIEDLKKALWYIERSKYIDNDNHGKRNISFINKFLVSNRLNEEEKELLKLIILISFNNDKKKLYGNLTTKIKEQLK